MAIDRDISETLLSLKPHIANVIGFHELLDQCSTSSPLQTMTYQVHLTASALAMATALIAVIEDMEEAGNG